MCGLTGFLVNEKFDRRLFKETLSNMTESISHRGPDNSGLWTDSKYGLGFGHRRLSVLDLSSKGHQPMFSASYRYVLIYNGEIYNHRELRSYLESISKNKKIIWQGNSDTETLIEGFELLGVEAMLNQTIGMFAFALWDKKLKELSIARDRMGEKPLYYGWSNNNFIFGSELHSIRAFHLFQNPICRSALNLYMRYLYVPAPYSIYKNIYKLEPGCLIKINSLSLTNPPNHLLRTPFSSRGIHLKKWWDIEKAINKSREKLIVNEFDLIGITKKTLHQSVKSQLISDVPIGSFLSGGIDSSLISSIMQIEHGSKLNTFTIGLKDKNFDESKYARKIARHLNTNHNEYLLLSDEVQKLIPSITSIYDEPFADSSQIPTAILSNFARKRVTVALSGDGGDELFGGYNRYFWSNRIWQKVSWLPIQIRKEIGRALLKLPVPLLSNFMNIINRLFFGSVGISQFGDKVHKFAIRLNKVEKLDDLYFSLITEWENSSQLVINSEKTVPYFEKTIIPDSINTFEEKMMYLDSISYLPDDILCKVDRAAMSVGLETRIPMLDHRVVELSWRIPLHMKIYKNKGKLILKKILRDYIPLDLIERPKMGFSIPLAEWLRTSLKDFTNDQLEHSKIKHDGYLDPDIVNQTWQEHQTGKRNWQYKIWAIIMFQSWLHKNKV